MDIVSEWAANFWSSEFWLPKELTWEQLEIESKERHIRIAQVSDLIIPFLLAPLLMILRHFVEKYILQPLGIYFGIPSSTTFPQHLETIWNFANGKFDEVPFGSFELDEGEKDIIRRYFQYKTRTLRPSKLTKFKESGWKTLWYICSFTFGICVSYNQPWFWDVTECWKGYPYHNLTQDVWSYYMLSLSYYISITISQFRDVHRKDFMEMLVHHLATVLLMSGSFAVNATRFGVLVLVLHDGADILLELAKTLSYAKFQFAKNIVFMLFVIVWIVTRLYLFPFHLIYSTIYESPKYLTLPPSWYVMIGFLSLLYLLHMFWTWFILKVAFQGIMKGDAERDVRSDDGDSEVEDINLPDPVPEQ